MYNQLIAVRYSKLLKFFLFLITINEKNTSFNLFFIDSNSRTLKLFKF